MIQLCEMCHGLGMIGLAIGSEPCTYCDEKGVIEFTTDNINPPRGEM